MESFHGGDTTVAATDGTIEYLEGYFDADVRPASIGSRIEDPEPVCKYCSKMHVTLDPPGTPAHNWCHTESKPARCSAHQGCDEEGLTPQAVMDVISVADAGALARYLATTVIATSALSYVPERQALQMTNCMGRVVLHVPLSKPDAATISAALGQVRAVEVVGLQR